MSSYSTILLCFKMKTIFASFVLLALFLGTYANKKDIKCIRGKHQKYILDDVTHGNIYSPGLTEGKPYPTPMICSIEIVAPDNEKIHLSFNLVDIALNQLCEKDQLIVFDGEKPIGIYCGKVQPLDILSSSNSITIQAELKKPKSGSGFNITFRQAAATESLCKTGEFQCRNRRCIPNNEIKCNKIDDCGDGTDEEDCRYHVKNPKICGVTQEKPFTGNAAENRIVGGREAVRGSWPWQVDMQLDIIQPNGHFCGGTLIHPLWFITAAHCLEKVRDIKELVTRIHLGNHHKYGKDPHEQVRYMKKYFMSGIEEKDFMKTGEYNLLQDIALVKLNAPVFMNEHIQVACLPELYEELEEGQTCFASGWGLTNGTSHEHVLKQVKQTIQPAKKCKRLFHHYYEGTMICAQHLEPMVGICSGDSGGPLVCKKDDKWYVYGATSFGVEECGIKPDVFSKVSAMVMWITLTMMQ